jgi:hypothetical protein
MGLEDATQEQCRALRAAMEPYIEDTVAVIGRRRGLVRFAADDAEVRYIARKAIELAVGLTRNPDRPEAVPFRELSS